MTLRWLRGDESNGAGPVSSPSVSWAQSSGSSVEISGEARRGGEKLGLLSRIRFNFSIARCALNDAWNL